MRIELRSCPRGGNGRRGLIGVTRQFIKPAMGVAERFGEQPAP